MTITTRMTQKSMFKKHSLLALLILNAPAWSMDMSHMDMGSMSGMDMSTHSSNQTQTTPNRKQSQTKTKTHIEPKPPLDVAKTAPAEMSMPNMDHTKMDMGNAAVPTNDHDAMTAMPMNHDMNRSSTDHHSMSMGNMQGGAAPQDARSADYSQGRDFGPIHPPMMMGNDPLMSLAVHRLEWAHSDQSHQGAYEIEGWWGDDWNRAVLKAEGKISQQSLADARTELLWRKPVSTFWNSELGVRQDSGYVNNRTWLALGINGISPYWLDLAATFYVRDQSQTALILNAEYDWRITQAWVLQPRLEVSLYGKNDLTNDLGQGLSEVQSGLRLRYDLNHQFAPYIGVEVNRHYGKIADLMTAKGEQTNQTFAVAGVAFWF